MKLSALILTAGIVAATLFACASPPPPKPFGTASNTPACDGLPKSGERFVGTDFVSDKAFFLKAGYQPQSGAGPMQSDFDGGVTPNSQYGQDLAAAFDMAPNFFKNALCSLTNVFIVACIDSAHCTPDAAVANSWGLREYNGGSTGEIIATSAALWGNPSNPSPAPFFIDYKNARLILLLSTISGSDLSNWSPSQRPAYSGISNNTSAMSVLAALAHEMGHVLWYDEFVPVRGQGISVNNFCGGFYTQNSWTNVDVPPNRWIAFGQPNSNIKHVPDYIDVIKSDLRPGLGHPGGPDFPKAGEDLNAIFNSSSLTGTLAAVSPDEDFVETYMLYVLLNAIPQPTDLTITIHGKGSNPHIHKVVKELRDSKYELLAKMSCFGPLPPIPPDSAPINRRGAQQWRSEAAGPDELG